jgi:hypothetical protein
MSDYDVKEHFQNRQQRFEAALAIYLQRGGGTYSTPLANIQDAIEEADELLAELEKTEE